MFRDNFGSGEKLATGTVLAVQIIGQLIAEGENFEPGLAVRLRQIAFGGLRQWYGGDITVPSKPVSSQRRPETIGEWQLRWFSSRQSRGARARPEIDYMLVIRAADPATRNKEYCIRFEDIYTPVEMSVLDYGTLAPRPNVVTFKVPAPLLDMSHG